MIMLTENDLTTVHEFVKATGDSNIQKMMVGPKMTAAHVGLLLKIVRACTAAEFFKYYETATYPRIRFNNNEEKIKETFWTTAAETFVQLGLVSVSKAA
jgi:hypothetical protein